MKVIDKEKYFKRKKEMLAFVLDHSKNYGEYTEQLVEAIIKDWGLEFEEENPLLVRQLFSKFDLYLPEKDEYQIIADLLEKHSFLDGNCCEVGAGAYPRLAELVIPKITKRKSHLTIYEPSIMFEDFNATIIKDKFTKRSNITNINTLFALYPCEATTIIAEKAFQEDKNLLLACCGCDHSTRKHPKWYSKYWAEDFCMDYKEKYGSEVEIIHWPSTVHNDLPIMIRNREKQKIKGR